VRDMFDGSRVLHLEPRSPSARASTLGAILDTEHLSPGAARKYRCRPPERATRAEHTISLR